MMLKLTGLFLVALLALGCQGTDTPTEIESSGPEWPDPKRIDWPGIELVCKSHFLDDPGEDPVSPPYFQGTEPNCNNETVGELGSGECSYICKYKESPSGYQISCHSATCHDFILYYNELSDCITYVELDSGNSVVGFQEVCD